MASLSEELRSRTVTRVLELPIHERIELALRLGDEDLALFMRSSGLDEPSARLRLTNQRQQGRTPSACAARATP